MQTLIHAGSQWPTL